MNHRDLAALMAGLAPVIRDYVADWAKGVREHVDDLFRGFGDRLAALESRAVQRGEKGDKGDDGAPGRDGIDGKDGAPGLDGKDGAPGPQGEKGLDGLPGKEGQSGRDGRDGLPGVQGEKGLDGKDGRDGIDGFGFDDLTAVFDGERTVTLRFVQGERVKEFPITFPIVLDRGVWREGNKYAKGDGVTFGGSFFIAKDDTAAKPETDASWRLAVKRGRDGKDGKRGAP